MACEARPELFSPAERSFLEELEQAVGIQFRVIAKVCLGDLVQPAKKLSGGQKTHVLNSINRKHVDFVLRQLESLVVVGGWSRTMRPLGVRIGWVEII